tara:strand:+ start:21404 stop:21940 length:537 start_codon:yes stop_codon:yes gene_type:complete
MRKSKVDFNNPVHLSNQKSGASSERWFETWLEDGYIDRDWEITEGFNWKQIDYRSVKEDKKCRVYLELKSRNVDVDTYRTTMIGANKLKKARDYMDNGAEVYFFFLFLGKKGDKKDLYFYDVKRSYKKLEKHCIIDIGGTNKRGCDEYKNHMYIPTNFLENIKKYKNMEDYKKKTLKI